MKKLQIALLSLGAVFSASAADMPDMLQSLGNRTASKNKTTVLQNPNSQPVLTRTGENTYEFGYCAGIGTALGYPSGSLLEAAIEIPTYMSKGWEGMKITKVFIGFGCNQNKTINLYFTDDLNGYASYMQEAVMTEEAITFDASGQGVIDQVWNEVVLDTPYEIDGNPFYIGYQTICEGTNSYPICFDLIYTESELSDIFGAPDGDNGEMVFYNLGTYYGSVCIRFEMEGEMRSEYDAMTDTLFADNTVLGKDDQFDLGFTLLNIGSETITGLDLSVTIGGVPAEDVDVVLYGDEEGSIPFGTLGYVEVKGFPGDVAGSNLPLVVDITALKGENGSAEYNARLTLPFTIATKTYPKNLLVEEFTGTWCGYCPRGIVGMEYMRETYGGKGFIGIACHYDDVMQANTYLDMIQYYSGGSYPSAVMNRKDYFDPSIATLETNYNLNRVYEALVQVDVDAQYDEEAETINIKGTAEFGDDNSNADYSFAFVVCQDNVGPYTQSNYFAGGAEGGLEGWSDKGRNVPTIYEMVARYIEDSFGIEGSIPAEVTADTPYEYSVAITLEDIISNINTREPSIDINNCYVVAMVLDNNSGEVMNCAEVSLEGQAGVESLVAEPTDGVYRVYNLQGVKVLETKDASAVSTLPQGVYVINGKKYLVK